ncbi:MAG: hypothetical protein IPK69_11060 [Phycisphaerales bacterium]|nr:MAG: hypothetical protein IPK69_11060 [Phycisphaerales bacterium]
MSSRPWHWVATSGVAIVAFLGLPSASTVAAQAEPFYVVVTADKAPLRCADSEQHYSIAELASGTVLLCDEQPGNWMRVAYPPTLGVFVRAQEAAVSGDTVTLTKDTSLKAASLVSGFAGSWKSVLAESLPAETTLKLIEPTMDANGTVVAYRVVPPAQARAWVSNQLVRRATDAEVDAYTTAKGPIAVEGAVKVASKTEPVAPVSPTDPNANPNAVPNKAADGTIQPNINPEATTPGAQDTTPTTITGNNPEGVKTDPTKVEPIDPAKRLVASVESLEGSFKAVLKEPIATAEYGELKAEFERTIADWDAQKANLKDDFAIRKHEYVQKQLDRRLQWLTIAIDSRERAARQQSERVMLDQGQIALAQRLQEFEASRVYQMIGTLRASTLYDGKRLPRMFRVESVGGIPHTIGYVKPDTKRNLDVLVGRIVGIIGDTQMDPTLNVQLITPTRIDELKDAAGQNLTPPQAPDLGTQPNAAPASDVPAAEGANVGG